MTIGLVGRKAGMTRVFTDAGDAQPVTVIQVTFGTRRASRLSKPVAGHYAKPGVLAGAKIVEFRLAEGEGADLKTGAELKADLFKEGQVIDVTGTTIGKGYAGVMKRHGFAGGYASHGASVVHRAPGSIGQRQTPGRVFPGKRMAGRMGNAQRTEENLKVVQVDLERNLLLVSGSVPGAPGGRVVIRPSVKAAAQARRKTVGAAKK
jgi:large subunit ribosomal protein L3